jgi:hypothetical protein
MTVAQTKEQIYSEQEYLNPCFIYENIDFEGI